MNRPLRVGLWVMAAFLFFSAQAAVVRQEVSRFDQLVIQDPSSRLGALGEQPEQVPGFEAAKAGWDAFRADHGNSWQVHVDRRTGAPLLVQGAGTPWFAPGQTIDAAQVQAKARQFLSANGLLLGLRPQELAWNASASAATDADHWVAVFDHVVGGISVEGESFILYVTRGRLVAFGASRWGSVPLAAKPAIDAEAARAALYSYMELTPQDQATLVSSGQLVFVAAPAGAAAAPQQAPAGQGVDYHLAWRFAVRVADEPGTWVGKVDALTGKVLAFYDDDRYSQVKGGVYPLSNDGDCANGGCELANFPMPFADVTISKKKQTVDDMGLFTCGKGPKNASTTLAGKYVRVADRCGAVNDSGNCSGDLDLGASAGTDCVTPAGHNGGDTHASRTSFYQINRVKEKARYWLPANSWLDQQLTTNVNITSTCNAYYNGSVNYYRSGGGCRNTGEIAGVVTHEFGHGLDQNDGGGYDNPSEGYADVVAIFEDRASCVGRGFYQGGLCSGYGDACLSCSGIRDMDFAAHASNTPATPANFTAVYCGGGGGPCGREVHCESYVPAEAMFDLATRDLPAMGLDRDTSWQLAEKLWYKSRQGSGGNAFNCRLPSSDGCGANTWFYKLRVADDDDGDLANGTPHAAAIFAAFNRHAIACDLATDPSNQNTSSCTKWGAPTLSASAAAGSVTLTWSEVSGAANYLILRNDIGCDASSNVVATVAAPATTYTDSALPAGFPVYYRIQAQAANTACESPVSACVQAAAQ